jgi:ATP-binding cassette, subfamily C, bacterial exporter for protease/lipase
MSDSSKTKSPSLHVMALAGRGFMLISVLSFFVNLSVLTSPIYMQQVFDRVLQTQHVETLLYLTMIVVAFLAAFSFLDVLRTQALSRLGRWWDETLRNDLMTAALAQARLSARGSVSVVNDLQTVRGFVGGPSILPFFDAPFMPLFIIVIGMLHPWLGLLAFVSAVMLMVLALISEMITKAASRKLAEQQMRLNAVASSAIRQADSIYAMGMIDGVMRRYAAETAPVIAISQRVADVTGLIGGITKFIRLTVQVLVLGLGAFLVTRGELTSGGMIAASIILGRALSPAEQAMSAWKSFAAAREAHHRIMEALKTHPPEAAKVTLPIAKADIAVEAVSFVLPGTNRFVLRNVTMTIPAGAVVALVGSSASGKSTLCRILVGALKATSGVVRIDGAALGDVPPAQLGRLIGYMPQSIEFMSGTIRDTIARMEEADDAAVVAAAQAANCHEMIQQLPSGYQTEIGEGGSGLSGGQRQRIGLARALYRIPKLVVLDEPNASLDSESENMLIAAIKKLKESGTTVIMVSHKMTALGVVDYIATLKGGQLEKFEDRDTALKALIKHRGIPPAKLPSLLPPQRQPAEAAAAAEARV